MAKSNPSAQSWISLSNYRSWQPEPARSGSSLGTISFWGGLPEVLSLRNLAALVAHLLGQDAQALQEMMRIAILDDELQGWTLGAQLGEWHRTGPRMMSVIHPSSVSKDDSGNFRMTAEFETAADGRYVLHIDGTGVRAADLLVLLHRRGRPVPPLLAGAFSYRDSRSITEHEAAPELTPAGQTSPPHHEDRDELAPLIREVVAGLVDVPKRMLTAKVWAELQHLAKLAPPRHPLAGCGPEVVMWDNAGERQKLDRAALGKRLRRAASQ